MIMTSYISWIATNVFQFLLTPPQMTCERHMNSGINLTCSVCLEYSSELEAF